MNNRNQSVAHNFTRREAKAAEQCTTLAKLTVILRAVEAGLQLATS